MSQIIIRLQNLPLTAKAADIREFFGDLKIPKGAVNIVGGALGDAFIGFASDEDARLAMRFDGRPLHGSAIRLLLSSRREMESVITNAHAVAASAFASPTVKPADASQQPQPTPQLEFKMPATLSASMAPLQQTPPKPLNQFLNVHNSWLANFNVEAKVEGADDTVAARKAGRPQPESAPQQPTAVAPQPLFSSPSFNSLQFAVPVEPHQSSQNQPPQLGQHQPEPEVQHLHHQKQQQPLFAQHLQQQQQPTLSQQPSSQFSAPPQPLFPGFQQHHQPVVLQQPAVVSQPQAQPPHPAPTNMGESWKSGAYATNRLGGSSATGGSTSVAPSDNVDSQFHSHQQPPPDFQPYQQRSVPSISTFGQAPSQEQPQISRPPNQPFQQHLPQHQQPHSQPQPFDLGGSAGPNNFAGMPSGPPKFLPSQDFFPSAAQMQRPPPVAAPLQPQVVQTSNDSSSSEFGLPREHNYEQVFEPFPSVKPNFASAPPPTSQSGIGGGFMSQSLAGGGQPPNTAAISKRLLIDPDVRQALAGLPPPPVSLGQAPSSLTAGQMVNRTVLLPPVSSATPAVAQPFGSGTTTGAGHFKTTNVPDQNIFNFSGKPVGSTVAAVPTQPKEKLDSSSSTNVDNELYVELTRINAELLMCPSALERFLAPSVPLALSSVKVIFDRNDHPQYALVRFGCVEDARRVLARNGEKGIRIRNSSRKEFDEAVEHTNGSAGGGPPATRRKRGGRRRGRTNRRSRSRSVSPAANGNERSKRRHSRSLSRSPRRDGGGGGGALRICVRLSNVPYRAEQKDIEDFVRASRAKFDRIQQIFRDRQDWSDRWVVELSSNRDLRYLRRHTRNQILGRPIDVEVISVKEAEAAYEVPAPSRRHEPSPQTSLSLSARNESRRSDRDRGGDRTASSSNIPNQQLFSKLPSLMSTNDSGPFHSNKGPSHQQPNADGTSPPTTGPPRITLEAKTEEELITRGDLPPAAFGAFSSPSVSNSRSGPMPQSMVNSGFHRPPDLHNDFYGGGGPGGGSMGRRLPFSGPRQPFYGSSGPGGIVGAGGPMGPSPFNNGLPPNRFGRPSNRPPYQRTTLMSNGVPPIMRFPGSGFSASANCTQQQGAQRATGDFVPQDPLAASLIDALKTSAVVQQQQQQILQAQVEAKSQMEAEAKAAAAAAATGGNVANAFAEATT